MGKRFLIFVSCVLCVSLSVSVANATGGVAPVSLSAAVSSIPDYATSATSTTSTTVPAKTVKIVKPVKTTVPVKPKNKNVASAVGTTVPVITVGTNGSNVSNASNIASGSGGSNVASGSNIAVVLPVEVPGLISVCANKSTSVLRDTANNLCASGEVKVEWLDTGMSPKICVNNNNREMTLAQDGKCPTKNSAVADVTANKQISACADDKTGVLRYQASGVCAINNDPVAWVLKDQGVARNVDSAVKKGALEIISLIPAGVIATTAVPISTATTTTSATTAVPISTATTTTTIATTAVPISTATTVPTATTTTTIASRVVGSFAGNLGGTCPDGSGLPWYWGSGGQARAGGCSAAASIAPISTGSSGSTGSSESTATTTTTTTVAPVVIPGTPATPTGVAGNLQVTVTVAAGTGGTPTSYTVTQSTTSGGTYTTGCTVTGASGSCVVTGLTNGTTYFFKATATNSAGTSGLSTASSAVTPATVPGAPTIGTATVASATSVTVACTTPGSNGGATITTYTATAVGTAITGTLTSATCSTAITVSGLTTGTAYTFTVTATNTTGTSVASGASNSVTPGATCATYGTCAYLDIGPGGGIVFYVRPLAGTFASPGSTCNTAGAGGISTCKYLEAAAIGWITETQTPAQTNCSATGGTSGTSTVDPICVWSAQSPRSLATTTSAIGAGRANTVAIIGQSGGGSALGYAASAADAYRGGGKTDWYLGSTTEMKEFCKYGRNQTTGDTAVSCANSGTVRTGVRNGTYWTSSEETAGNAQYLDISASAVSHWTKADAGTMRPIRAFG